MLLVSLFADTCAQLAAIDSLSPDHALGRTIDRAPGIVLV